MIRKKDLIDALDLTTIQLTRHSERIFALERRVNELEMAARKSDTPAPKKRGRKPKNATK